MDACDLTNRNCVPCRGGVPPLDAEAIAAFSEQLGGGWAVIDNQQIEKEYTFSNFAKALAFTNVIGELAEAQGHHPDLQLGWGRVKVMLSTHKIGGLSESDFILAAHIEKASAAS